MAILKPIPKRLDACQDCGRMICYDAKPSNIDVIDQAYVTESGDLFCHRCALAHDRREKKEV